MDWSAAVDNYCERIGPELWAEPLNALTNLVFIGGAMFAYQRVKGDRGAVLLCLNLTLIGICSGAFHLLATRWSETADSVSILLFILVYVYLAARRILSLGWQLAGGTVILFFPYAAVSTMILVTLMGPLNGTTPYLSVLLLIAIFAMASTSGEIKKDLFLSCGILGISLLLRTLESYGLSILAVWHAFLVAHA